MSVLAAIGINAIDKAMDLGVNAISQGISKRNQKDLMDYSYEMQKDFWNKQNAYNDPSSQMVRLRAAGLNPAMLNGNAINNTAGGLSSISSPSAPQGIQPHTDITAAMQGLSSLLTDEKQRGLLSVQTQKMGEEILNLWVEREYKQIMKRLGLTDAEMKQMDKEAMFEAYYGSGLDGGSPRIKNNPIKINMDKAKADLESSIASSEYTRALKESEDTLRDARKSLAEAQTEEARAAAKDHLRSAELKAIQRSCLISDENRKKSLFPGDLEAQRLENNIKRYAKDIGATQKQIAELELYIKKLWAGKKYDYSWNDVGNMLLDFIHSNLRLAGSTTHSFGD